MTILILKLRPCVVNIVSTILKIELNPQTGNGVAGFKISVLVVILQVFKEWMDTFSDPPVIDASLTKLLPRGSEFAVSFL